MIHTRREILSWNARPNADGLRALRFNRRSRLLLPVFQRSADECRKQWMRLQRLGFELRMKLAAQEPRVVGRLDDFDVIFVRRPAGDQQPRVGKNFLVIAVKFVTVAMALANL